MAALRRPPRLSPRLSLGRLTPGSDLVKQSLSPEQVVSALRLFAANLVMTRSALARSQATGELDPPGRDLNYECGYPSDPGPETYRFLHRRNGVARRVNDVWADECFAVYPEVYETEEDVNTKFEQAWKELNTKRRLFHYIHRADRLSGIGRFGVLLFGFRDGRPLASPVAGLDGKTGERTPNSPKKAVTLDYLVPFAENFARVTKTDTDELSPRFMQPVEYELRMGATDEVNVLNATKTLTAHWTRVLHLADNRDESDVAGTPRMEPVLNYLLDLRKISGGSAEMFWKGAFPGFAFETLPDLVGESVMDEESVRDQLVDYMSGLQRYLALDGVTAKPLLPQAIDPSSHARQQLEMICLTLGIPLRIFMGSEASHQASTQDTGNWNKRVSQRQHLYVEPMVLRPLIDRLIMVGVLPQPVRGEYKISWQDLNTVTDKDRALITLQRAQAMMQYVSGGCEAIMPVKEFLTLVMGFGREEVEAIMTAVKANTPLTDPLGVQADARATAQAIKVAKATPKPTPAERTGGKPPKAPGGQIGGKPPKAPGGQIGGKPPKAPTGRPAQTTPAA